MPSVKRRRTHGEDFAELAEEPNQASVDYDPEDEVITSDSDSGGSDAADENARAINGRAHYHPVSRSRLRHQNSVALGPQYAGSKVSRNRIFSEEAELDPVEGHGSEEESEDVGKSGMESEEHEVGNGSETDSTSVDQEISEDEKLGSTGAIAGEDERAELRRLMDEDRGSLAASMSQAAGADAEKGRAIKRQRKTFDSLLNCRIRLQQGLIAINSMQALEAKTVPTPHSEQGDPPFALAERAALNLWNNTEQLRRTILTSRTGNHSNGDGLLNATPISSTPEIWNHMTKSEESLLRLRRKTLHKWSEKTQSVANGPLPRSASRLNPYVAGQPTVLDVVGEHLGASNLPRLVARTQTPRSCAPVQASESVTSSTAVFDDADFYGVVLKELLEQRNVDAAAGADLELASQQWRAAREVKTRKGVDTKASKGRKLRYTVHEKLQNFMAPEDRRTWGDRQIEELFGSLLGKRMMLDEGEVDEVADEVHNAEEALMLFRS